MIDPGASTSSTDPIAPFARHYPQQQQQQQQEHLRSRQRSRPLISPLTLVVTRRRGNNQPDNNNNFKTSSVDPLTEPLLLLLPPERLTPREGGGGGGGDIGAFLTTMRASVSNKAAAAAAATISNSSKSAANHDHHHDDDGEEGDREVLCCSDPLQDDVRSSLDDDDDERSRRQRRDDDDDSSPIHHHHVPWYKNPYQRMAMISNFCTSYNVVNISLVLPILEQLHKTSRHGGVMLSNNNDISTQDTSIVASSLLAGMIFGQVVGGALGDASWIGGLAGALRAVMVLQIVASFGSASVYLSSSSVMPPSMDHFYWELATWRFVLGIGAGAVYPLAACLSVEQAGCRSSGGNHVKSALKRVVRTFSMQGVGFWMVPAITLPLLCISSLPLQYTWRIILALGAVPGLVLLIMQWHLYRSLQTPAVAREQTRAAEEQEEDSKAEQQQQSPWRLNGAENDYDAEESHLMEGLTDPRQQQRSAPLPAPSSFASGMRRDQSASSFTAGVNQRHLSDRSSRDNLLFSASSGNDDVAAAAEDSDGEVGTFLDSAPDLSSGGGCYGASEPPVIRYGWWASIVSEKNLCQKLLGTAATWFLFDVLFYGNTLFQAIVVEATFGASNAKLNAYQDTSAADHARQELKRTATDSLILASIALPGYIVAGILIGRRVCGITQSVRFVMMQGFCCMSILYLTIGWYWTDLRRRSPLLLVILYGMTFFFANYGPNTTTFVLPALVYSPECRSTWNGFSAAAGKLGALFGATFFAPAARQWGDATVMLVCAAIGAVAFIMTLCFVRIPPMQTEQEQRPAADGEDAQQQRRPSNITSNHEAAGVQQPSSLDASVTQPPSTTQTVEDPTAAAIPADQGLHA
ncbi:hypothetical protein ACA910_017350 [Epithemia clementina (nom. ined.)]